MVAGTGLGLALAIWSEWQDETSSDWGALIFYVVLFLGVASTFVAMVRALRVPRQRGAWPDDEWLDDEWTAGRR